MNETAGAALLQDEAVGVEDTAQPQTQTGQPMAGAAGEGLWEGLSPDLKGWLEVKGVKNVESLAANYRSLEKVFGADKAGRTVVLPKEGDPESEEAFYKSIGRPEKPEDYKLTEALSDVPVNPDFLGHMQGMFHQAGLTAKQAGEVAKGYQTYLENMAQANMEGLESLKSEWGVNYNANIEVARRAAREFGFTQDELGALENAFGAKTLITRLQKVGQRLSEDKTIEINTGGFNFSPEGAKAKIDDLFADKDFQARYMKGDKAAVQRITDLSRIATGGK